MRLNLPSFSKVQLLAIAKKLLKCGGISLVALTLLTAVFTFGQYIPLSAVSIYDLPLVSQLAPPKRDRGSLAPITTIVVTPPAQRAELPAFNMIRSIVAIQGGSGVVIWSGSSPNSDLYYTYAITNKHVVEDHVKVAVRVFEYAEQKVGGIVLHEGTVVAKNPRLDLALVRFQSSTKFAHIAEFNRDPLHLNDEVHVVGCGASNPPFITNGNLARIGIASSMVTAPAVWGNSGGGTFTEDGLLCGITRNISGMRDPEGNMHIITHLVGIVPSQLVEAWIIAANYGFIFGAGEAPEVDETQEAVEKSLPKKKIPEPIEKPIEVEPGK